MNYVVGIVTDGSKILLLRKNNPDWQKGLYNGVGGKVNLDETPLEAIIRECQRSRIRNLKLESNRNNSFAKWSRFNIFFCSY